MPLQVDLAAAHVALLQRNVKSLCATVKSRRRSEVNEHFVRAAKDVADFSDSEMLATRAKANLKLVERRKEVRERIDKTSHDLAALAQLADNLSQQRKRTEDKIDTVGLTGAIGLMLRKHKASLPEVSDYRQAVRQRQPELKDSQLAALELEERRADLADLDAALGTRCDADSG